MHSNLITALRRPFLYVQNDILKAMDKQKVTILMPLHLSAAFDTVDHKVLLRRLSQDVDVAHHALKWFKSYMNDRTQSVHIHDTSSSVRPLHMVSPKARCSAPGCFLYTQRLLPRSSASTICCSTSMLITPCKTFANLLSTIYAILQGLGATKQNVHDL